MTHLDPDTVVRVYRQLIEDRGRASCADVAAILEAMGVGHPTRQGILWIMKRHPDGPELLAHTLKRTGKQ